ncbi:hypothetical protein K1719_017439 [Acacia pycnantha]|nr:hypothetical protein K1719_017439 [Acacia pycnantha]
MNDRSPGARAQEKLTERNGWCHYAACLRASRAEVALEAPRAAIVGGISVLEVVMSTPGVFEVIQQLIKEHPEMALGVGTVLRVEDAKTAIKAGAKLLMSPAIVKERILVLLLSNTEFCNETQDH